MRYIYCILSSAITFFCFLVNKIKYCHTWKKSLQPVWMNAIGFFICIWLNMRFRQRLFKVEGKKAWLCRKSTAWLCVAGIWKQNVQQFFLALDCWEVWDWCNELIYSSSCRVISLCLWNYKFVTGNLPIFFFGYASLRCTAKWYFWCVGTENGNMILVLLGSLTRP